MAEAWGFPLSDRAIALRWAIDSDQGSATRAILERAELFHRFLVGQLPVRLVLTVGPIINQTTRASRGYTQGESGMAQLHDDQQFDVTVSAKDAKGFDVADAFTASVDDESVATVVSAEDGKTFTVVAGNPGSAVLTVTDGNLSATLAVDVVPGDVALISLTTGDPVDQP